MCGAKKILQLRASQKLVLRFGTHRILFGRIWDSLNLVYTEILGAGRDTWDSRTALSEPRAAPTPNHSLESTLWYHEKYPDPSSAVSRALAAPSFQTPCQSA